MHATRDRRVIFLTVHTREICTAATIMFVFWDFLPKKPARKPALNPARRVKKCKSFEIFALLPFALAFAFALVCFGDDKIVSLMIFARSRSRWCVLHSLGSYTGLNQLDISRIWTRQAK